MEAMAKVRVHALPESVDRAALVERRAVVFDVLRATTTIVAALAAGARAVIPCLSIDEARKLAMTLDDAVLGGERGGLPIGGFDLGNSPAEYTPAAVAGKTLVLTTTNGTRALLASRGASEVLVGALVNLSAVHAALARDATRDVDLVCAGTDGQATDEDLLAAGALVERLAADGWRLDAAADAARCGWQEVVRGVTEHKLHARIVGTLRASRGGRNLIEIGMEADVEFAADVDHYAIAARFDAASGRVVR
jgi:2-phosphosulfolactate phosphatase